MMYTGEVPRSLLPAHVGGWSGTLEGPSDHLSDQEQPSLMCSLQNNNFSDFVQPFAVPPCQVFSISEWGRD